MFVHWLKTLVLLGGLTTFSLSYAFDYGHEVNSRNRPFYGSNTYIAQQVQYGLTDAILAQRSTKESGLSLTDTKETESEKTLKYQGYVLRVAAGVEHFRFLQTGITYSNVQEADPTARSNELRSQEFGTEAKIMLSSPVINVVLGGEAFLSQSTLNNSGKLQSLSGSGVKGTVELAYFASPKFNLNLSVNYIRGKVTDKGGSASIASVTTQETRAGAGFTFWL